MKGNIATIMKKNFLLIVAAALFISMIVTLSEINGRSPLIPWFGGISTVLLISQLSLWFSDAMYSSIRTNIIFVISIIITNVSAIRYSFTVYHEMGFELVICMFVTMVMIFIQIIVWVVIILRRIRSKSSLT
jgi:hypothetical protein